MYANFMISSCSGATLYITYQSIDLYRFGKSSVATRLEIPKDKDLKNNKELCFSKVNDDAHDGYKHSCRWVGYIYIHNLQIE